MNVENITGVLLPSAADKAPELVDIASFVEIQTLIAELVIPLHVEPLDLVMFVDADDRRKGLPPNLLASSLRWLWDPASRFMPMLHGDVLLTGGVSRFSEPTDVPSDMREALLNGGPYQLEALDTATGDWQRKAAVYADYSSAASWAVIMLGRDRGIEDVRIVPVAAFVGTFATDAASEAHVTHDEEPGGCDGE